MTKTREQLQKNTDWEAIKDKILNFYSKNNGTISWKQLEAFVIDLLQTKQMEYQQRETAYKGSILEKLPPYPLANKEYANAKVDKEKGIVLTKELQALEDGYVLCIEELQKIL